MRPKALAHIKSDIDLKIKTANAWAENKPWINDTEREEVVAQVNDSLAVDDSLVNPCGIRSPFKGICSSAFGSAPMIR